MTVPPDSDSWTRRSAGLPEAVQRQMRELARLVENAAGPGVGFAMFFHADGAWNYVSNADRAGVVTALAGWIVRMKMKAMEPIAPATPPVTLPETSTHMDERLALERKCASIAKRIGQLTDVGLFLFPFGDEGSFTYCTSVPNLHHGIEVWVRHEQGRS